LWLSDAISEEGEEFLEGLEAEDLCDAAEEVDRDESAHDEVRVVQVPG
jgi:hypothetical protein